MGFIFMLLMVFQCSSEEEHDVTMALFHIFESESVSKIVITLDAEDFSRSLGIPIQDFSLDFMDDYLQEHINFQFESIDSKLIYIDRKFHNDHIIIEGRFDVSLENIHSLEITNTCLVNIPNQTNLVRIDLNDVSRDFRMHKGRTRLEVYY